MSLKVMKERIHNLIGDAQKNGPVYLVFHDASQDVKYVFIALLNTDRPKIICLQIPS